MAPVRPSLAAALFLLLASVACAPHETRPPDGVLVVSQEQTAAWIRNFNPLTAATSARWPTLAGIYEPLYVFNSAKSEFVPWLAVEHEWSDGNRTLRMTTREGVLWSDGEELTAEDVAFTFGLLREIPAMDRNGVWAFLDEVLAVDRRTVEFRFGRVYVPGLGDLAAQIIVPEHVWSKIDDPMTFANESP
ncbi:MAG TPA: ABC transporter substrate-binding protein, partial [bacterium]|nr:ABC transporter substrate-binding protein [bacterium]